MEHESKQNTTSIVRGRQNDFFGKRNGSHFFSPAFIQPRLTVGPVDDPYEREADAMADKIMRMSSAEAIQEKPAPVTVQRKCSACEEEEKLQRKPAETVIQRAPGDDEPSVKLRITMSADPEGDLANYREANIELIQRGYLTPADYTLEYGDLWNRNYQLSTSWRLGTITRNLYDKGDSLVLKPIRGLLRHIPLAGGFLSSKVKLDKPDLKAGNWDRYIADKLTLTGLGNAVGRDHPAYNDQSGVTFTVDVINIPFDENKIFKRLFKKSAKNDSSSQGPTLFRKCSHCEEEENKLQMKPGNAARGGSEAPSIVSDVMNGAGHPMDTGTRYFMESRFGYDFGNVQIHNDSLAHQSSNDIDALAYTHGNHIVFGSGQYRPATEEGKRLLAHELTHVVQQTGDLLRPAIIQRVCLPDVECGIVAQQGSSVVEFGEAMEVAAAPARHQILTEAPALAQLRSHGQVAVELERIFQNRLPNLRALIHHIIIDETLPPQADAARTPDCKAWADNNLRQGANKSAFTGATQGCILAPKALEDKAALYNRSNTGPQFTEKPDIEDLLQWHILRPLVHEVTHQQFDAATINFPGKAKCTTANLHKVLSELAACINEFPIINNLNNPTDMRGPWIKSRLKDKRDPANPTESIAESIHDIRCHCECADADSLIKQVFEFASSGWSKKNKNDFHLLMKSDEITALRVYWPYEVHTTGPHEFSLTLGSTGSNSLDIALITYRYALYQMAAGRFRLTTGLEGNLASFRKGGEYGAALLGAEYIGSPTTKYNLAPSLIARFDTGIGVGEYKLLTPTGDTETVKRGDFFLQIGAGIHFFIPAGASKIPTSVEAAYRATWPLDEGAKRIDSFNLTFSFSLPERK